MWKKLIRRLADGCEFQKAATVARLDAAEAGLGVKLPEDLRSLLGESDGVEGEDGNGLIWPVDRIIEENLTFRRQESFRDLYMPFDHLLFFADAGDGNQFAFPIQVDGLIHRPDVFAWCHEDDSRKWVAPSLKGYLERCASGEIEL